MGSTKQTETLIPYIVKVGQRIENDTEYNVPID